MQTKGWAHFYRNHVRSIPKKNKLNFFRQMGILTGSGIPLLRALMMLQKSSRGPMKSLLTDAIRSIEEGSDFSEIGKYYTSFFDKTTRAMIVAGENSGTLPQVFKEVYTMLDKKEKFKRSIKGAMAMPIFSVIFALGVVFFMALKVIPSFTKFLSSVGAELPGITKSVLVFSDFMMAHWKDILIYGFGFIAGFVVLYKMIKGFKYAMDYLFLQMPLVGPIILYGTLANFSGSMQKLFGSGVGLLDGLRISNEGINSLPIKRVILQTQESIIAGSSMYQHFESSKVIPVIYADLLYAGEESGSIDEAFAQLAQIYEEETDIKIATLKGAIGPVMTLVIGGMVGYIATALILGMVSMWSATGG
ncbi:MAG TPA: type II secretion system F family protein [Epsilonproteobacteria bacterium]|nr:type II secretion system F family protein [Campylobacterota bacterium]